MIRFHIWLALNNMTMWIDTSGYWAWHQSHTLFMKVSGYFLEQSRKHIPDEFQDQLVERIDL